MAGDDDSNPAMSTHRCQTFLPRYIFLPQSYHAALTLASDRLNLFALREVREQVRNRHIRTMTNEVRRKASGRSVSVTQEQRWSPCVPKWNAHHEQSTPRNRFGYFWTPVTRSRCLGLGALFIAKPCGSRACTIPAAPRWKAYSSPVRA